MQKQPKPRKPLFSIAQIVNIKIGDSEKQTRIKSRLYDETLKRWQYKTEFHGNRIFLENEIGHVIFRRSK